MAPLFHFAPPCAPLRDWVRQHQLIRLRFAPDCVVPAKPYWPRPAAALAFYLRDPERVGQGLHGALQRKPRAVLIGQPTAVTQRLGGNDFSVYQVEFQPGALHRLTGLPLHELRDRYVDAEAVFPPSFRGLVNQLEDLEEAPAQIAALEAWLLAQIAPPRRPLRAADRVARLLLHDAALAIDPLATAQGLDARQLRRQFDAQLGVGPKLFARIVRFDQLVRMANRQPHASWLQLAVDAGYHDHQHLARDFREFTQCTPSEFRALEGLSPERQFGYRE